MGLYKRKGTYWFSVKPADRPRIFESTHTGNRKLAERIYAKALLDVQTGQWFEKGDSKKHTLRDMISRYEMEYTEDRSYYCKRRDKSIFKHLGGFFGEDAPLVRLEETIGEYEHRRKRQGVQSATVRKELGLLSAMFNVAIKQWKWKLTNPVATIKMPKASRPRVRYLSADEFERLFRALDEASEPWLKPLIVVALNTGLRLTNVCDLQWREINLSSAMISLDAEKMKNGDYLGIPLTSDATDALMVVRKVRAMSDFVFHDGGKKLYDRKVQRAFRRVLKKAQIGNFHFHDLRHSFASYMTQNGVDLYRTSKLMGHKDLRMTQRYAHLSVEHLRDAVAKPIRPVTNVLHGPGREAVSGG